MNQQQIDLLLELQAEEYLADRYIDGTLGRCECGFCNGVEHEFEQGVQEHESS